MYSPYCVLTFFFCTEKYSVSNMYYTISYEKCQGVYEKERSFLRMNQNTEVRTSVFCKKGGKRITAEKRVYRNEQLVG